MKKFLFKYQYLIFAIVGTVIVLWQLLLPGYVILLDWPATAQIIFRFNEVSSFMNAPVNVILYGLNSILSGWAIQKVLLVSIFLGLFYFPLRFYPLPKRYGVEYLASLFFAINPFVYERMLAGQWRVVMGYALLFPLVSFLIDRRHVGQWSRVAKVFGVLLVIGFFSTHFFVIGGLIIGFYWAYMLLHRVTQTSQSHAQRQQSYRELWRMVVLGCALLIISSYWIVPYVLKDDKVLTHFDESHQRAFATAMDERWGVLGNVMMLHGFWGEDHVWVERFTLPKDGVFFGSALGALMMLVASGFWFLFRRGKYRLVGFFLLFICVSGIIFSVGVRSNIFQGLNGWLFAYMPLWSGFRDSQKWIGLTMLVYAVVASHGWQCIVHQFSMEYRKKVILTVFVACVPLLLTPQLLRGFDGQIQSVWYPASWTAVNDIVAQKESCRALFLPWHQYYSLAFNDNHLSGNVAAGSFSCDIISGHNTELWNIRDIAGDVRGYDAIREAVTSNNPDDAFIARVMETLRQQGVTYIIWTNDLVDYDLYKYPFLQSNHVREVFTSDEIVLYEVIDE